MNDRIEYLCINGYGRGKENKCVFCWGDECDDGNNNNPIYLERDFWKEGK